MNNTDLLTAITYGEIAVGVALVTYLLWRQTIRKVEGPLTPVEALGFCVAILYFCLANAVQQDWTAVGMWVVVAAICGGRWWRLRTLDERRRLGLFEPPSPD
jgi:hypothetical protein